MRIGTTTLVIVIATLLLGSLAARGDDPPPAPREAGAASYQRIGRYTVEQLNAVLTTEIPELFGDRVAYTPATSAVVLYRVSYPSVIPERHNRPTTASGLVAIPETDAKALPVVSYQHGTVYGKEDVPSFPEKSFETRLVLAQFAGQGYVVIAPDYFGMGTSPEDEGYGMLPSHQQACLDLHRAALAVLSREGIAPTALFLAGWSQGGLTTLAFLEAAEREGLAVTAAATASGPADGLALLGGTLFAPRPIDASWGATLFPLTAFAFERYHGIPGLAEGLFTPEAYPLARRFYEKETLTDAERAIVLDLHRLIRPEFFDPQAFAQSAYGRLVATMHPYRWPVRTPLRMYYGGADEVVRPELARLPMLYQQALGNTKVEAISAGDDANHRKTFGRAVAKWKAWFDERRSAR
jgi:pimeloyl-ACP methyl ester carboxylesterase